MARLWAWWKRVANQFAHEVYLDEPLPTVRHTSKPAPPRPLSITDRLFILLAISAIAGIIAWQLAVDRRSSEERASEAIDDFLSNELSLNDDSWVRRNPLTFGVGVGVGVYILGVLTIVAIEQRPNQGSAAGVGGKRDDG